MAKILLVGAPGAGKGTLSSYLRNTYKLPTLSTGDLFRRDIKNGTELGKLAASLINAGNFVPDDVTVSIVETGLDDLGESYILDGFPRNLEQAKRFDNLLAERGEELDIVVHLVATDDFVVDRLSGRRVCETCGETYHVTNNPSRVEGVCDVDGGVLSIREDDKPELIRHRLATYHDVTAPLLDYYADRGIVYKISGMTSVDELFEDADTMIDERWV